METIKHKKYGHWILQLNKNNVTYEKEFKYYKSALKNYEKEISRNKYEEEHNIYDPNFSIKMYVHKDVFT